MGFFDKFKKTAPEEMSLPDRFKQWLDSVLRNDIPSDVAALCFNIYENENKVWSVEIVGTSSFDENDDWACDEITDFGTREKPFSWREDITWEKVHSQVKRLIQVYLESGAYSEKLKESGGIACGFVDGDLEIVCAEKYNSYTNDWNVHLYYSREYGVIIVDNIPVREPKGAHTAVNPEGYPNDTITPTVIGNIVLERMSRFANMPSAEKLNTKEYWSKSGIRSFKKFSFTYSNVKVFSDDCGIHIIRMKVPPQTGGYAIDRSKAPVNLPAAVSAEELGETLLSILRIMESQADCADI